MMCRLLDVMRPQAGTNRGLSRRWWWCGIVSVVIALWSWGYFFTEASSPIRQAGAVWARCFGNKYQRTIRESDTNIAVFHLSYAIQNTYSLDAMQAGRMLPLSWPELIRDTGGYAGSHMAGTLIRAYPFLAKPVDPWGRPWVFRLEEIGRSSGDNFVELNVTIGSLGPDGLECDSAAINYETRRRMCDDLLITKRFFGVPPSSVPAGIPINSRTKPEVFTVPRELWQ